MSKYTICIVLGVLGASWAFALDVIPYQYDANISPGGNSWYVDNSYTGNTGGALSGGVGELVDGVKGTFISSGYSQWEPYSLYDTGSSGGQIIYTYYFDQVYAWDSLTHYNQIFVNAAVRVPNSFTTEFSVDGGASFHSSVYRETTTAERSVLKGAVVYDLLGSATGYFADVIRVTIDQPSRWWASDEVEFTGTPVPEVAASGWFVGMSVVALLAFRRRVKLRENR